MILPLYPGGKSIEIINMEEGEDDALSVYLTLRRTRFYCELDLNKSVGWNI